MDAALNSKIIKHGLHRPHSAPDFAKLVGAKGWARLAPAIRRRFADHDLRVRYDGEMDIYASWLGAVFAVLTFGFGKPLPLARRAAYKARVNVFPEDGGGVVWQRDFLRPNKPPIRIESVKKCGPGGDLLECVRRGPLGGIGMGLSVFERAGALCFESQYYFLHFRVGKFAFKLPIPTALTPGRTLVTHKDEASMGAGKFRFTLTMTHRWFGKTVHQEGIFIDPL